MKIKDLIKILEAEYEAQLPYADMMGEPEILIDIFDVDDKYHIRYCGVSPEINITSTSDGIYRVLTAWKL